MSNQAFQPTVAFTVDYIYNAYKNGKFYLDKAFQRESCWPQHKKEGYINSLIRNEHSTVSIHVFDVNNAKSSYAKSLKKEGKRFVTLDGNNRITTIVEFLDGKFKVRMTPENRKIMVDPSIMYGNKQFVHPISKRNWVDISSLYAYTHSLSADSYSFDALPEHIQVQIRNSLVKIELYSQDLTEEDCTRKFWIINNGESLTNQERRNSMIGNVPKYVREKADEFRTDTTWPIRLFSSADLNKRKTDEHIAKMFYAFLNKDKFGTNTSIGLYKKDLDGFYGSDLKSDDPRFVEFNVFMGKYSKALYAFPATPASKAIEEDIESEDGDSKKKASKYNLTTAINLAVVMMFLGGEILNYDKFAEVFLKEQNKLLRSTKLFDSRKGKCQFKALDEQYISVLNTRKDEILAAVQKNHNLIGIVG